MEKRGIDINRVIFGKKMPPEEHFARLKIADLWIDNVGCVCGFGISEKGMTATNFMMAHSKTVDICASLLSFRQPPSVLGDEFWPSNAGGCPNF